MLINLSIKKLLIVLSILLIATIGGTLYKHLQGNRTFKEQLSYYYPSEVRSMDIIWKKGLTDTLHFQLENNVWNLYYHGQKWKGNNEYIKVLITSLAKLKATREVTHDIENYSVYDIEDSTSIHAIIRNENKELVNIKIGGITHFVPFRQRDLKSSRNFTPEVMSFVRLNGSPQVYSVKGDLRNLFQGPPQIYRDNTILRKTNRNWSKIEYLKDGIKKSLITNSKGKWIDEETKRTLDSTKVNRYLNFISEIKYNNTLDIYQEPKKTIYQIKLVEKSGYKVNIVSDGKILISSENVGTSFDINSTDKNTFLKNLFYLLDE